MFKKAETMLVDEKAHYRTGPFDAPSLRPCGRSQDRTPAAPAIGKGAVLLDGVLGMAIFVFAAAVVQSGLVACLRSVSAVRLQNQAVDLAVTKLSEIQMGLLDVASTAPTSFEDEDESLAEWSWQITTEPVSENLDAPSMTRLTVTITNTTRRITYQLTEIIPSPDQEDELSLRGNRGSFLEIGP